MTVQPYLIFDGRCEEAVDFYRQALCAEVTELIRFRESPEPSQMKLPEGWDDKILHVSFRIGQSEIMASDGGCGQWNGFAGFSLALATPTQAQARRWFEALSDGGQVQMPLARTFFSPQFGMVADRFGVSWMVITTPEPATA